MSAFEKEITESKDETERAKDTILYVEQISKESKLKITEFEDRLESAAKNNTNLKDENQSLTQIIGECEKRIAELENVNATMKKELFEIEQNIPNIDAHLEKMKSLSNDNFELAKKVDKLEEFEQNREVVIEENVQKLLDVKNKKIEKLETEIQKLIKNHKIYVKKLNDFDEKAKMNQQNMTELSKKNAELIKSNQRMKMLVHNLSKKLETINPRLSEKRRTIANQLGISQMDYNNMQLYKKETEQDCEPKKSSKDLFKKIKIDVPVEASETDKKKARNEDERHHNNDIRSNNAPSEARNDQQQIQKDNVGSVNSYSESESQTRQVSNNKSGSRDKFFDNLGQNLEADIEDYLEKYLSQNDIPKVQLENSTQTDYFPVIDFIIEHEEEIRYNELDLERIKEAADILADMIGFMGIQDYAAVMNELAEGETEEIRTNKENRKNDKKKDAKSLTKKPVKNKSSKINKNTKIIIKKNPHKNNERAEEKDGAIFPDFDARETNTYLRAPLKKAQVKVKMERHEAQEDGDNNDDYIVQKSKVKSQNNQSNLIF